MSKEKTTPSPIPQELTFVRTFDAPRDLVFKAWADPVHLAKWWGPEGFTTTMKKWEAHPGGAILLNMNSPHGEVYPMGGAFVEVSPPEMLVFKASALDPDGKAIFENLNTVSFGDAGGKTKLTLHTRVLWKSPDADQYLEGMKEGWNQSLVRLGALVGR